MKCPRCGLIVKDRLPQCRGCGFRIEQLDRKLKAVPKRIGFVNDWAGMLSPQEKSQLEDRLAHWQRELGGELVVATVKSTRPAKPAEYAFWLFNRWQIGGETHAGLLILLAQKERRIECEVGYAWEPILSDLESGRVLDECVLPRLKEGQIYEALRQGLEQCAQIIQQVALPKPGPSS